jgi:hypothetical protein
MMALATTKPYICQYCNHGYTRESTLFTHVCEQKRRALAQNEKHVVLGFEAYNTFLKQNQNRQVELVYLDFCKSPYYNAFVKFGSFVSNVKPLYPFKFIQYVVRSGVKLDHWCRDDLYDKYVVDLIRTENVATALERSINHMLEWADANNSSWDQYFSYVSLSRATYDIKDGKISPWLILNCQSGKSLLKKLDDGQLSAISVVIDPQFWMMRFRKLPNDVAIVNEVITASRL